MPLTGEVSKSYGPSGLGEIRVLAKSKTVKVISSAGDVYPINFEDVAEGVPIKNKKKAYFGLDQLETRLLSVRPWDDAHFVEFGGFTRRGNADEPTFKTKKGGWRDGREGGRYWEDDRLKFTAVLDIIAGDFEGYSLLLGMDYMFVPNPEDTNTCYIQAKRESWLERIYQFLDLSGFDRASEDIPYSTNVLPWLETILLKRAKKNRFQAIVEEGWIDKLARLPTGTSI